VPSGVTDWPPRTRKRPPNFRNTGPFAAT
jgi:hypothetical protein